MGIDFLKNFKNPWEATGEKVRNSGVLRNVVDEWAEKNQAKILGQNNAPAQKNVERGLFGVDLQSCNDMWLCIQELFKHPDLNETERLELAKCFDFDTNTFKFFFRGNFEAALEKSKKQIQYKDVYQNSVTGLTISNHQALECLSRALYYMVTKENFSGYITIKESGYNIVEKDFFSRLYNNNVITMEQVKYYLETDKYQIIANVMNSSTLGSTIILVNEEHAKRVNNKEDYTYSKASLANDVVLVFFNKFSSEKMRYIDSALSYHIDKLITSTNLFVHEVLGEFFLHVRYNFDAFDYEVFEPVQIENLLHIYKNENLYAEHSSHEGIILSNLQVANNIGLPNSILSL